MALNLESSFISLRRFSWSKLRERRVFFIVGDLVAASLAIVAATWLGSYLVQSPFSLAAFFQMPGWYYSLVPIWLFVVHGLFDQRKAHDRLSVIQNLSISAAISLIAYLIIFFFVSPYALPRLVILLFVSCAFFFTLIWRMMNATFVATWRSRVLVVGAGWAGQTIAQVLTDVAANQYDLVGFVDDDGKKAGRQFAQHPVLASSSKLLAVAQQHHVSSLVLAITGELKGEMFQALLDCAQHDIDIVRMVDLYEQITGRVPIHHIATNWQITSFDYRARITLLESVLRRGLDIASALVGMVLLAIVFLPVAFVIWWEDHGPILYTQTRLGRAGRHFKVVKFRTMSQDAEADGNPRWAEHYDTRVTSVGRLLRKLRVDELPQFWNVLMGEMSIIGPRPERPELLTLLETNIPFYRARLAVKPGLTGWAQVNYGYAGTLDSNAVKLQYDLYYIKHRSLWLDLLILWRTIITVIRLEGT